MARILVIDDETPMRALIAGCLRVDGHEVVGVGSGEEGLRLLQEERFDLLAVDLVMPGLSGYEMIDQVRAMPGISSIPVMMLSNVGDPYNLIREGELGVLDHVQKPFGYRELEDSVSRVLQATPEKIEELRVIRDGAAEAYKQTISLIEDVHTTT